MGFGTSKPDLLGCTGTSVHLEETLTTSPSLGSPQVALVSTSRCPARFRFLILVGLHELDSSCLFAQKTLTPHNKGMIRRAISQSGVALCPWAVNRNPRKFAEEVHNTVNLVDSSCGTSDERWCWISSEIIACITPPDCSEGQLPH